MTPANNEEFLRAIFGEMYPYAHCCGFPDDPSNIASSRRNKCWAGGYFKDTYINPTHNTYYCVSLFAPDENNRSRRRKQNFSACRIVPLDDVEEKLPIEQVNKLPKPSYILQTSHGSYQYGYILDVPCTEIDKIDNLHDGLVNSDLAPNSKDPGQKSVSRYIRMPYGTNSKKSKLVNGQPVPCQLIEWHPERRVSLEALAEPFGINLNAPRRGTRIDGAADLPDHPLLDLADIITIKEIRSDGRFDISCPWVDEHTGAADDGAAIFTNNDGSIGYKCHHGSCAHRTGKDLLDLIEESYPGFRNRLSAYKIRKSFEKEAAECSKEELSNLTFLPEEDALSAPIPLPDELLPVKECSDNLIPSSLRPWAKDICERIQCPLDFIAVTIMVSMASLIGRKIGIRPQDKTDWTSIVNMWAMIVGRPGVLKSPAIEASIAPLKRLMAEANNAHQSAFREYQQQRQLAQLRSEEGAREARNRLRNNRDADVSTLLQVDEPEEPTLQRYVVNDTTFQALGELLRQNPNGVLVHRDEIVSLLKGLDREEQVEARGFYLTGWNGDSGYTFDRIGRGMNIHIPALCLSLLGGTQPGRLSEYVRHAVKGGAADDGLIQRFGLLVWPDTGGKWRNVDRWPDNEAKKKAFQTFKHLDLLQPETVSAQQDIGYDGEPDGVPYLRFDNAAQELFLSWRTTLEHRLRSEELHPAMESHLAKYRKLIPSLALITHLAEGGVGPVTASAVTTALDWGEYLESHALRVYGSVSCAEVTVAKAIIKRIRKGDLADGFSCRDIYRKGWSMLTDRGPVESALQLLVDYEWLQTVPQKGLGRPTAVYLINPQVLE